MKITLRFFDVMQFLEDGSFSEETKEMCFIYHLLHMLKTARKGKRML